MRLPDTLSIGSNDDAIARLSCYYGTGRNHPEHARFTGAWFDTWDPHGARAADIDRFTVEDLYAASFLSVTVHPAAGHQLLVDQAERFTELLREVPADRDLVSYRDQLLHDWAGWKLDAALKERWQVGPTTASKLLARKRPGLRPIWDDRVQRVIGLDRIWEPLRAQLQTDPTLHSRLEQLRADAGLPERVSAIRVFDVLVWMDGTHGDQCPMAPRTRTASRTSRRVGTGGASA